MRILIANKYFYPRGGSEVVMLNERAYLRSNGVDVVDFSTEDPRNVPSDYEAYFVRSIDYENLSIRDLPDVLSVVYSHAVVKKFNALLDAAKPDLLHCHNIYHQLTPSIIGLAKRRNIPVVLTMHDYKLICPTYHCYRNGAPCTLCVSGAIHNVLFRRCADKRLPKSALLYAEALFHTWQKSYQGVDAFLAPSQFAKQSLLRRYPDANAVLLPNGAPRAAARSRAEEEHSVVYIGRVSPEKGVEALLKAHLLSKNAWRLLIVGDGPDAERYRAAYRNAQFLGNRSGAALERIYSEASIIVQPSVGYENAPLVILEAMANGKPVVASRIGGIPELVANEVTGLLCEPGDVEGLCAAIDALMADPTRRRAMGAAALRVFEARYTEDRHNATLLETYRAVIGSRNVQESASWT